MVMAPGLGVHCDAAAELTRGGNVFLSCDLLLSCDAVHSLNAIAGQLRLIFALGPVWYEHIGGDRSECVMPPAAIQNSQFSRREQREEISLIHEKLF